MNKLINSHALRNIVINYEESQVIKDILRYQNEVLEFYVCETKNIIIISLPNYNHVIKFSDEITNITNSAGAVLILKKVEHLFNKDLYEFKKELFTNNNSQFEHFGHIVEISLNENFIFVTTKTNKLYIYNTEGVLLQSIENLEECLNNIPYFNISDNKEKINRNVYFIYKYDYDINKFILDKINVNIEEDLLSDLSIYYYFSLLLNVHDNNVFEIEDILC